MDLEIANNQKKLKDKTLNQHNINNNKNNFHNNNNNSNNNNSNNNNNIKENTNTIKNSPGIKMVFDNRIKRKNVLALNEKVAAIREYQKRPIYKRIGRMFHCSPDQIKRIVQQKDAILTAWEQRTRKRDAKSLEMKVVRVSMLGKAVYEWIRRMMYYKDILITDGLIQKMALQFKSAMGLQNFFPHQDWCDKFRAIYKIIETDSKLLNIGYSTGHSVQIKDVVKDVLSECSPDDGDVEKERKQEAQLDSVGRGIKSISRNSNERLEATNSKTKINSKGPSTVSCPTLTPLAPLPNMRQLVALPIQGGTLTGGPQKVLVATPLTTNQIAAGTAPMTMTIIPLATLGRSTNLLPTNSSTSRTSTARNKATTEEQISMPPPIIDIKKEIKEEPKNYCDGDNDDDCHIREVVEIKEEYISCTDDSDDVEADIERDDKSKKTEITEKKLHEKPLPAFSSTSPQQNQRTSFIDDTDSTNDSLEDVALAQLKHHIKEKTHNKPAKEKRKSRLHTTTAMNRQKDSSHELTTQNVPPLIKISNGLFHSSTNDSFQRHTAIAKCGDIQSRSTETLVAASAIKTCSQARAYLKLLEDFALERESFRLIGLITRADEVLRELDRKENGGAISEDDIEDIDID